jgi:hypothetical protein
MSEEGNKQKENPSPQLATESGSPDTNCIESIGVRQPAKLNAIIWAHSDQAGGNELACVIAKALILETQAPLIGIITPFPERVDDFFEYEIVTVKKEFILQSPELLRIAKSKAGWVDARETYELLRKSPFDRNDGGHSFRNLENIMARMCKKIEPRKHDRTLMISCGEPIAVEVASRLNMKCVIITDHLLTSTVRWVLRHGGLFDRYMADLLTVLEDYDRKADKAFISPPEFAGSEYEVYLGHGSIDCNFVGGLFYEPIYSAALLGNPGYRALVEASRDHRVVFVFGGGGPVWFRLYDDLHEAVRLDTPQGFAVLIPAMETSPEGKQERKKSPITKKFLYTLYLPDGSSTELEDPGRLMYWYAACALFVGRGGLAAQQIFATMMSDIPEAPEMLFIEEPGHPQIEHERQSLYNLGFVHTRTLDAFRANPLQIIREVFDKVEGSETRARVSVRYGKDMMSALARCLVAVYKPYL